MYRNSLSEAEALLRTAHAACAERDRLQGRRQSLEAERADAERITDELAATLTDEQRDVRRYERGVWAFLYDLFADRAARLTAEQREAAVAEAKYHEAATFRDRLTAELADLDARLGALASADADLATARSQKQAAMIATDDPRVRDLDAITHQLATTDAEGGALDEAIVAGDRAYAAMANLVSTLSSARSWGRADLLTDSMFVSWAKRQKLDDARALGGTAQAELLLFARELGDVGMQLHHQLGDLAAHHRFMDTWFDNIFSDWSVQSRIGDSLAMCESLLAEIGARVGELRTRRNANLARSEALAAQRMSILES